MKSSKYEYRVVTAPGNRLNVQFRAIGNEEWKHGQHCYTVNEAKKIVFGNIEEDNFIPQVVEI